MKTILLYAVFGISISIISLIFLNIVERSTAFFILAIQLSAIGGIYSGYCLRNGKISRKDKI